MKTAPTNTAMYFLPQWPKDGFTSYHLHWLLLFLW